MATAKPSNGNGASKPKAVKLNTDDEGNLIDPPILPEYERRMTEATSLADIDLIADVQADYDEARIKHATRRAEREREATS